MTADKLGRASGTMIAVRGTWYDSAGITALLDRIAELEEAVEDTRRELAVVVEGEYGGPGYIP